MKDSPSAGSDQHVGLILRHPSQGEAREDPDTVRGGLSLPLLGEKYRNSSLLFPFLSYLSRQMWDKRNGRWIEKEFPTRTSDESGSLVPARTRIHWWLSLFPECKDGHDKKAKATHVRHRERENGGPHLHHTIYFFIFKEKCLINFKLLS